MNENAEPRVDGAQGEPQGAEQPASSGPARRGDKAPRKRGRSKRASAPAGEQLKGAAKTAVSKRLEQALAEVLVFPSVPSLMLAPDPLTRAYLAEHFTRSGPKTAHELVAASESSPELRRVLERIATGSSMFTVALAVVGYAAPPVLWVIGSRELAQQLTIASTMDESTLAALQEQAIVQARAEAAQAPNGAAADAEHEGSTGSAAAEAGADPGEL